jgi:hypothetical protein
MQTFSCTYNAGGTGSVGAKSEFPPYLALAIAFNWCGRKVIKGDIPVKF